MSRRANRQFLTSLVIFLFACPLGAQMRTESFEGQEVVANEVLLKFKLAQTQPIAQVLPEVQLAEDIDLTEGIGSGDLLKLHSRTKDVMTLVRDLSTRSDVAYAEPNFIVHAITVPNDTQFGNLWGLQNTGQVIQGAAGKPGADISAVLAWNTSTGSSANVVAVVDTGVDYNHPDLAANVWSAPSSFTVNIGGAITCPAGSHGFNAITKVCDPLDDASPSHGTHVSGTIGAVGNNSLGVVGVNWTASIMGSKFLNSSGSGTIADAINAIEFAIQSKTALGSAANVRVLSNSWGGGGFSQALLDEINRANSQDILFVAAAGNSGSNNDTNPFYPASYNALNVISVAATDNTDAKASFSNFGASSVHLAAPGVNVLSTLLGGNYGYLSGTSMATPHVSGAAALVLSRCALNTANLKTDILNNVDSISSMAGITTTGGRLNVNRAITACTACAGLLAAPLNIWWPNDGSILSGTQPFKARLESMALACYQMYWAVDGGQPNLMADNSIGGDHKEVSVDLSGWTWRDAGNNFGPFSVSFIAQDSPGHTIQQKAITIYVAKPTLSIWWPTDGSVLTGTQPFKARLENVALTTYQMYWSVDGGQLNFMSDAVDHKEASVDLSGWTWRDAGANYGPFAVTFTAKNSSGIVLQQKTINIFRAK
jgi:subtilisin family serine protease